MQNDRSAPTPRLKARWKLMALAIVVAAAGYFVFRPVSKASLGTTFTVRRGPLRITVVENGSIEAKEAQEARCEVKGWQTKILSLVEEGYQVTEEDVRTNKVLVELDPAEIRKNLLTTEIDYQGRQSAWIEAQQAYEIQLAQNQSDIKNAAQKARFARLDIEKYMGDKATAELTGTLGLDEKMARLSAIKFTEADANGDNLLPKDSGPPSTMMPGALPQVSPVSTGQVQTVTVLNPTGAQPAIPQGAMAMLAQSGVAPNSQTTPKETSKPGGAAAEPNLAEADATPKIDYAKYANVDLLGDGEAQQKLREARDALLLAEKEKSSGKTKLDGTERLFKKGFVNKTEWDTDQLAYEQVDLKVKKSSTALTLFNKYEFPKQAEELVSKFEEALRALERTHKEAIGKLAQSRARLKMAEQQFRSVQNNRKELLDQLEKCQIRAKKPGLVIYGGTGDGMIWYGEERIREGATVRERQPIITIPDMSCMSVKVKIHESHIKKVTKGMKCTVRVDAQAEKMLTGEVTKVGVLPDSQNRWMNPDLKLYNVTVDINGTHDWLKPGMSAKVEILANELKDVVYAPIQAIAPSGREHVAFVPKARGEPERRGVEIGEYSDEFIEIKKGLKEGELVLLRSPQGAKQDRPEAPTDKGKEAPKAAPVPARAPAPAGPS